MRVAIVGGSSLCALFGERLRGDGREVQVFSLDAAGTHSVELLSADSLDEFDPDVVVVVGPEYGERDGAELCRAASIAAARHASRLVYWGAASAYGDPASLQGVALNEDAPLGARGAGAPAREADEVAQSALAERPDAVHLFRAAPVGAQQLGALMGGLGALRNVPIVGGQAYVQCVDGRDAAEIVALAVSGGHPGMYNVAADEIVRVEDVCRATGREGMRLPTFLAWLAAVGARLTGRAPSVARVLRYGRGTLILDNTRLKTHFGYRPRFSTREAIAAARAATAQEHGRT